MSNIYLNKITENLDSFNLEYDYNYLNFSIGELCANNKINLDMGILQLSYYIENFTSRDRSTPDYAYYLLAKIYLHKNDFSKANEQLDNAFVYYNSSFTKNRLKLRVQFTKNREGYYLSSSIDKPLISKYDKNVTKESC